MALPDVRAGDVWLDGYPYPDERTVTVEHVCAEGTYCTTGQSKPPHAHVVSNQGRRSVIAQRRFKPGNRGYSLVSRAEPGEQR